MTMDYRYLALALTIPVLLLAAYEQRRKALRLPGVTYVPGLPVLGQLGIRSLAERCRQWHDTYGELFQIQLGEKPILVVTRHPWRKTYSHVAPWH